MSEQNKSSSLETVDKPTTSSEVKLWENLDVKKKTFALVYARTGNRKEACEAAGCSPQTTYVWQKDIVVASLINHHIEEFQKELKMETLTSKLMIERCALDVYETAMGLQDTFVINKEGEEYAAPVTNLTAANQALSTLQRIHSDVEHLKVEKEKGPNQVVVNIEQANFDSNQDFTLFQQSNRSTHNDVEGDIIEGEYTQHAQ